jgi:PPOX class probable F420-dependent enzyme
MTDAEIRTFLLDAPRTATLATVRGDGRPRVAPIWFDLDGDEIVFTAWHASVKMANLRRDPRVALCVDDEVPPYAYVVIEGVAALVPEPSATRIWATRIGGLYMGVDRAEEFGARNGDVLLASPGAIPDGAVAQRTARPATSP